MTLDIFRQLERATLGDRRDSLVYPHSFVATGICCENTRTSDTVIVRLQKPVYSPNYYTLRWTDTIWSRLLNLVILPIGYQLPVERLRHKFSRFVAYNLGCSMDRCDHNYEMTLKRTHGRGPALSSLRLPFLF